ncbi:OadG family protein [bacterium]|nr:OadG family protein [bacterium]
MKINKLICLLLFILVSTVAFAMEEATIIYRKNGLELEYVVTKHANLLQIAQEVNIPVKNLKLQLSDKLEEFKLSNPEFADIQTQDREWDNLTLEQLDVSPATVVELHNDFVDNNLSFGWSVTLVGVTIVFLSLLLISIIVAQLQRLEKKAPKESKKSAHKILQTIKTPIGNITGPMDGLSANAIVAVITAIHKHKVLVEERMKIEMTFKRTPVNMWGASAKLEMPNSSYKKNNVRN